MPTGLDPADVFDLRFVRDAQLSPDGRQVVCAISSTDRTFVLAVAGDPQNLDPHGPLSLIRSNLQMTRLLYDPLVNLMPDGDLARASRTAGTRPVRPRRSTSATTRP